jgi:signal transduction histidine kinase/ActR/RegA family two-component response regulator
MSHRLRLLWIAESAEDGKALHDAEQALGVACDRKRVRPSEVRAALGSASWDLVVCSVVTKNADIVSGVLEAVARSEAFLPAIVIADAFQDVASGTYAARVSVCERSRLSDQLSDALRAVLVERDRRQAEERTQAFARGQRDILERVAGGAPVREVLAEIVRLVELQSDEMLCSVLILDRERGLLFHGASDSLPPEFVRAIDGSQIGPNAGSCGAAAFRGLAVIVEDIATHPYWAAYRALALPHGLRACWSSPIFSPQREVLGTFAMYYRTPRGPTAQEAQWVDGATYLASIALQRDRADRTLRRNERLESLSTLASGIAHDFNNILTAISGNVSLIGGDLAANSPAHESLSEIERACARATDLVTQIATFGRTRETKRRVMRFEPVLEVAMQQLRAELPSNVRVSARYVASLPEVFADADQLRQLVSNLGKNAAQAMGAVGGAVTLHAQTVDLSEPTLVGATELKPGTYVRLDISDTGPGIPTRTLDRIFEPFFTTKGVGEGAGLGLSVVHGIVKSHEGAIDVRSTPSEGSCFSVYFPAASAAQLRAARPANLAAVRGEGERVLCIDDEEPVVRVTAQMLRRLGFEVVGAIDPVEALSTFESDPAKFDVVLTDFAMPRLSCFDLARAIQKVRPALPIVVTSGRIDADDVERLRGLGIREVVFKPSTIAELSAALRRALRNVRTG